MRQRPRRKAIGAYAVALSVALVLAAGLVASRSVDRPALAQRAGGAVENTKGDESKSDVWREVRRGIQGSVSLPNKQAGVLIQSEGDNWRAIRNGPLSVFGGWMLFGMIAVLALFFAVRGRIRIVHGWSGRLIERFGTLERFTHWLTAGSFVVLALTGLNMLYGRYALKPIIGPTAFSMLTRAGKYAHDYIAFAFMLGVVLMFVLWVKDNIPDRLDLEWLRKGGGLFGRGGHAPARKFNAGQKIIFWLVCLGGLSLSLSGLALLFPFELPLFSKTFAVFNIFGLGLPTDMAPIQEMQISELWHAVVALVMIAVIIAHIYIGTIGMEGAFDAMGTGMVDENWAAEHHDLWVAQAKKHAIGDDD